MYSKLLELVSLLKKSSAKTVNRIFQLHSSVTCLFLIAFSVFVTSNQYFGDPINCMPNFKDEIPEKVLNNYCWVRATYSLPKSFNEIDTEKVPYPGLDAYIEGDETVYHTYYQWVGFFLFFQAILFQIPRMIWKITEGGTTSKIILNLDKPIAVSKNQNNEISYKFGVENKNIQVLANYFQTTLNKHGWSAYIYYFCELLNFVNVVGQIYFTNSFLHGEFTTYGTEVFNFTMTDQVYRTDPMVTIFPRVTKCTFRRFGVAGSVQNIASLCILPVNVFNEKIFIFLWFWYVILSILSGIQILVRVPLFSKTYRWWNTSFWTTQETKDTLQTLIKSYSFQDWFLLSLLKTNLTPLNFEVFISALDGKTENPDDENDDPNNKANDSLRYIVYYYYLTRNTSTILFLVLRFASTQF